jgi:hypothetical protein
MLYRKIMALHSERCAKHISALCGQNVEFLNVKTLYVKEPLGVEGLI